jgi:hypothetical protein
MFDVTLGFGSQVSCEDFRLAQEWNIQLYKAIHLCQMNTNWIINKFNNVRDIQQMLISSFYCAY